MNILRLFNKKEKLELCFLLLLIVSTGFVEMIGMSLIFPFMNIISTPEKIYEYKALVVIRELVPSLNQVQFFILMGFLLLIAFVFKNLYYMISIAIQQNYLIKKRVKLTSGLYKRYIHNSYEFHINNNSALLMRNINNTDTIFSSYLQPIFIILTESCVIIFVVSLLLYSNWKLTAIAFSIVALPSIIMQTILKEKFIEMGKVTHELSGKCYKLILESFQGIKELQIMKKEDAFQSMLESDIYSLSIVRRNQIIYNQGIKVTIELLIFFVMMGLLLFFIYEEKNVNEYMPLLTFFSIAMLRIMLSVNKITASLQQTHFSNVFKTNFLIDYMDIGYSDFNKEMNGNDEQIEKVFPLKVVNLSYQYPEKKNYALQAINLEIQKGDILGIVGESGAGKSTLFDVMLTLLQPTQGGVYAGDRDIHKAKNSWRDIISYIPQTIFLLDDTLVNNIKFDSKSDINKERLKKAIDTAQLSELVNELPLGIDTMLGENGVNLSGGQRQRIAIARALYNNSKVLFLDEATSALDDETEKNFIDSLCDSGEGLTMIMIAHRKTSLIKCNKIIELSGGKIIETR